MKNCSDIVKDDDDDVQNRNIAGKIVSGLGCRDDLANLNQPQIKKLKDDVDNILKHIDTKVVLDQTNAIALEKTATAIWASKRQLAGAKLDSEASALELICKDQPDLCEDKKSRKTLSDSYKKSAAQLRGIAPLTDEETTRLLQTEFNPLVNEVNALCHKANAEYSRLRIEEAKEQEKNAPKVDPYREQYRVAVDNTRVDKKVRIEFVQAEMLLAAGNKSLQDKFSQLLDSKLGHLMMSKSLQEKVGIFNPANFRSHCAGGDGKMLKHANLADIKGAKAGFNDLLKDELEKVTESHDTGALGRKSALKTYLKNNPLTIAELLKKNPGPEYANLMCYLIRDINTGDQNWEYFKTGVTAVGVVASVALAATGVGAPAGAALFATVTMTTAISAGATLDDYFEHKAEARMSLQAGATHQDNKTAAIDRHLKSEEKADGSFKDFATTVVLEAAGFGVGKIVKVVAKPGAAGGKLINSADDVVNTESKLVVQAEHADDVSRAAASTDEVTQTAKSVEQVVEETPVVSSSRSIFEGKTLEKVEVELDIPKVKIKTRPAVEVKKASRFGKEIKEENQRLLAYLENTEPQVDRVIPKTNKNSMAKLAEMYKNNNPKDMIYRIKKKEVTELARGGEAVIYTNPSNKDEALKIWHTNRQDDFRLSLKNILLYEEKVAKTKELSQFVAVSKVKEVGPNYIVKEFFPNSIEISKVTNPQDLKKLNEAIKKVQQHTRANADILNQKLYDKLVERSGNLHWDPATEKIVIIDALGF